MNITELGKKCPINYEDGWAVHYLTETDLYKYNMGLVMFLKHPDLCGDYIFKCRNKDVKFDKGVFAEINRQLDHLCTLRYTKPELDFLRSIPYLGGRHPEYIEFLKIWKPLREYVNASLSDDGELSIVVSGPLFMAMQFEIYLLEIVSQSYFTITSNILDREAVAISKTVDKIKKFAVGDYTFSFAEFGARRRLSAKLQDVVTEMFLDEGHCVGTSNVYLAMKYGVKPIGTYAHEFVQMYQGIPGIQIAYSNKYAMDEWFEVFNGDNGTALTDTLTTDIFLMDLDYKNALCYSGFRHDSGDPFVWGEKIIAKLKSFGIDPKTKLLLFSDSLDFDKAQKIYDYFKDRVKVSFGIGTFITNDSDVTPLNIVVKLQYVNGNPVAKISDEPGKTMCQDTSYQAYLKSAIMYRKSKETKEEK